MNRPLSRDTDPSLASALQHVEWLRQEIEDLFDATLGAAVDEGEVARLRSEIENREDIISRYQMLGLLS